MDTKKKENSEQSADEASLYNTIASVIPKKQDVVRIIGKMTNPAYGFTGLSQLEKMRHTTLSKLLSTSLADEFCFIDTVEEVLAPYTSDYNGPARKKNMGALALGDEQYRIRTLDGLKATPWIIERTQLCEVIIMHLDESCARVLVRAPYSSGKTSLAQLLQRRLSNTDDAYIISLSKANGDSWEVYWKQAMNIDWARIESSQKVVYIIIDEVQIGYRPECGVFALWSIIKDLANTNPRVRFICFGAYGTPAGMLPTPIEFPITISFTASDLMPGMMYLPNEFVDLCEKFAVEMFTIDHKSANYLYYMTNGYAGIIGWILVQAFNMFKNNKKEGEQQFYLYLHSANLLNAMTHETCRAIPDFAANESSIELVCKRILSASNFKIARTDFKTAEEKSQLNNCLKASMVVDDGGMISFAAPIIQNKALAYFFGTGTKPASLYDFVISVVQRFSTTQLTGSDSRDTKSRLMEAQWQQEFYRSAGSVLPQNVIISPEYGREQGVDGQVDFYVAEYKWMIEILCEGLDMTKHEDRFKPGGAYEKLVDVADVWAVIDFRGEPKAVRCGARDNTYHFCFSEGFTHATIHGPGNSSETITILGDEVQRMHSDRKPGSTLAKLQPHANM